MSKNLREERIGETQINNQGLKMTIIEYRSNIDIDVQFEDGTILKHKTYNKFKHQHNIMNYNYPTVCGVGYIGYGDYSVTENGKHTDSYTRWKNCLNRAYKDRGKSYIDVSVCEEWHNYQNFAKWYDENYYEVKDEIMCLDKDILIKNNKIYSPNSCIFVPNRINLLFVKNKDYRNGYPIGVVPSKNKFVGQVNYLDKTIKKEFSTIEDAFSFYKFHKERIIKEVADEYKDLIPLQL
jgi:hypothetical protein